MDIKLLNDLAKVPTRGSEYAAGYDLYAATDEDIMIRPHETNKIGTGIAMAIPEGYFGGIFARSGIATKQGLRPANCVGIVDSDYRGPIGLPLYNDSDKLYRVLKGDRVAQLIVQPYLNCMPVEVKDLDKTERGNNGFGSSGK